jgi:hypothetical protein
MNKKYLEKLISTFCRHSQHFFLHWWPGGDLNKPGLTEFLLDKVVEVVVSLNQFGDFQKILVSFS